MESIEMTFEISRRTKRVVAGVSVLAVVGTSALGAVTRARGGTTTVQPTTQVQQPVPSAPPPQSR
jgi:hypothetical protein